MNPFKARGNCWAPLVSTYANNWVITDKGDQDCRILADDHYTRQTRGDRQFCRTGLNLVFTTVRLDAVWVTWSPDYSKTRRMDGLSAWECTLFRRLDSCPVRASVLIMEAVRLTVAVWGLPPSDGILTYVDPRKTAGRRSRHHMPGHCYVMAGWERVGQAHDGKPMLRAPTVTHREDWRAWAFRGDRGGVMRNRLVDAL